jgi:hypothetical protein
VIQLRGGHTTKDRRLDRLPPRDWEHVERYGYGAVAPASAEVVERTLRLPAWHWSHSQGQEGACVGHGAAMMMALFNRRRYDAFELYRAAQRVDEWPGEDYSGTSVRAALDVLRERGPARLRGGHTHEPSLADGVAENRWATTVDEMRTAIAGGAAVAIGVAWYGGFDAPRLKGRESWLPEPSDLGSLRGGHSVCIYGASDRREAFRLKNSWGAYYPLAWLPYATMERLLHEDGEATLAVDR